MSEACEQYQAKVDEITEMLRTNEQELFQAEARVNEIDARLQEMHNDFFERYYNASPEERGSSLEFGADELIMEGLRRELEAAANVMYALIDQRELLADLLNRALDELACCEQMASQAP